MVDKADPYIRLAYHGRSRSRFSLRRFRSLGQQKYKVQTLDRFIIHHMKDSVLTNPFMLLMVRSENIQAVFILTADGNYRKQRIYPSTTNESACGGRVLRVPVTNERGHVKLLDVFLRTRQRRTTDEPRLTGRHSRGQGLTGERTTIAYR